MFITGIGIALPEHRYTQAECWETVQRWDRFWALSPRSRHLLKKVLNGDSGVSTRHLGLADLSEGFMCTPDVMQARFARHAPMLASQAATRALRAAGLEPEAIDAVIISTCTGYLCPGLTSYVVERADLRRDVLALDLVGQGCGAALPNLRAGASLVQAGPCRHVLSVCVEVCSAALYFDDDPGVLISACLFGDGAAAAVLSHQPSSGSRVLRWGEAGSLLDPGSRDLLRFEQRDGLLRNVLTPPVPALAARHAHAVFRTVTARAGLERGEIAQWVFHAGGRDVLAALQQEFELEPQALAVSAAVLRDIGNISSPFILHVLERTLQKQGPGGHWWLGSFGAGFSSHGALLEVE